MTTFDKIKEILKNGSGRCVVLYNDDPHYVAMTWQEYRKFVNIEKTGEIKNNKKTEEFYGYIDINDIPL